MVSLLSYAQYVCDLSLSKNDVAVCYSDAETEDMSILELFEIGLNLLTCSSKIR